jgi:hypothetical protein
VGGHEHLRHATGLDQVEAWGYADALVLGGEDELGLRAAADDPEDLVARPEGSNQWTGATNRPRELEPGDVGWNSWWWRVATGHLHEVAAVDPRTRHLDHQLIGDGHIDMALGNGEVVTDDRHRLHFGVPQSYTMVISSSATHTAASVNLPNAQYLELRY